MADKRYKVAGYQVAPDEPGSITNAAILGDSDSLEDAEQLRTSGAMAGWEVVKVIDTHTQKWVEPTVAEGKKPREDFSQAAVRIVREATEG